MKKRIFLLLIAFSCAFLSIFVMTPRVFASTIADYNLFDLDGPKGFSNCIFTRIDAGFEIEVATLDPYPCYVRYRYSLLPDTQYTLTYSAEPLIENSYIAVYHTDLLGNTLNYVHYSGGDYNITTDSTGEGYLYFYANRGPDGWHYGEILKTRYYNIRLAFTDEALGAAYVSGYNSGYYDGAKPYEEDWEVFIFDDDSLIDRRWKENHTIENPGSQGNYYRSSALLTLPLGYYRVEQRFLDYTGINRPRFFDPAYSFERDFPPILYLDENSSPPIYLSLDFAGDLNNDRYIYFSVPYDNCQVRFQFVANAGEFTAWSASYTSLYQLIELSYDANFNIRYYEIFKRGYDVGKNEGYTEGKNDGIEAGYWDGYNDGREVGSNEGYNVGYNEGYNIGFNEGLSSSITTNWFTSFINSIFNIFNVEIFPNVKLIYLIFIPLGLGVIALIFKLIRG